MGTEDRNVRSVRPPRWWATPWAAADDPDLGWEPSTEPLAEGSGLDAPDVISAASAILDPLEAELGQTRSRDRVRDLAEVFTHQREVQAILDTVADAFRGLDVKFLEPTCGSGNFLTEILRRKLELVSMSECASQEHYEHRLLRGLAAIYGIDVSAENVTEARARMAHVLIGHFQSDANTVEPTSGFVNAAGLILGANIVQGDTLSAPERIELCDWQPVAGAAFRRVWSHALVPPAERDLFWSERAEDALPVHYANLTSSSERTRAAGRPRAPEGIR